MSWDDVTKSADWMAVCRFIISVLVLLGTLGLAAYIVCNGERDYSQAALLIIGAVIGYASSVIQYYLGSSSGSATKDKILNGGIGGPK